MASTIVGASAVEARTIRAFTVAIGSDIDGSPERGGQR